MALFNATGSVDKRKHPPNSSTTVLTELDKIVILETVLDRPEVLLRELQQTLILETGTYMCRCQHHLEILAGFKLHKTEDGDGS